MNDRGPEQEAARIAICEDERIVALDIKTFLVRSGSSVVGVFSSAEELLENMARINPDLVLMDINLEGDMDGVEASRELFERWSVPVIFLTAYADPSTIERAKLSQPFGYVIKPFDERDLKTALTIGLYRSSMERKLKASEARYRGLFEAGLAAVFLVDGNGTVTEGNRAYEVLAGGRSSLKELIADSDSHALLMRSLADGKAYGPVEMDFRGGSDGAVPVLLSAAPLHSFGQERSLIQALDISDRKSLQDQLNRAQKMEALGRLAGGAAHDFNNIITAVLGYAKLLRYDINGAPELAAELDGIEEAAKRAATLARQLLVFSRTEAGGASSFRLADSVTELERMLSRLVGEDVSVRIHPGEGDFVRADRTRIEQVVMNLVVNAKDAMPHGGCITIATGLASTGSELSGAFGPIPPGNWAYLSVEDEGTGIGPEILPHVFEPFFSTKDPDRGTGLGLSTVAGIVRQADGHIAVKSSPGSGTAFTVYFPPVADMEGNQSACVSCELRRGAGETILLVENDGSVRTLLETLLERAGYTVMSAGNPGTALLLTEGAARKPEILITDVVMPLMRGPELAGRLRQVVPGLGVLFTSGRPEDADMPLPQRAAFLAKPFDEAALLDALGGLLDAGTR